MGVIRKMSGVDGDAAVAVWGEEATREEFAELKIPDTVEEAIEEFDRLRAGGYVAYRTNGDEPAEVLREFDPAASEIIVHRQMAGG